MSSLRYIDSVTATGVRSVTLQDVFSADYDVYKVILVNTETAGSGDHGYIRFVNNAGILDVNTDYQYVSNELSTAAWTPTRATAAVYCTKAFYLTTPTGGGGSVFWIANPYIANRTHIIGEGSSGTTATAGNHYFGAVHNQEQYTGINIGDEGYANMTNVYVAVYGLVKE
jgi:hypothetical protein